MIYKSIILSSLFAFVLIFGSCENNTNHGSDSSNIPFQVFKHYFVRNDYQIDSSGSYLIFKDFSEFDLVFHVAAIEGDSIFIKDSSFMANYAVGIIKPTSNVVYRLNISEINLKNNLLTIKYISKYDTTYANTYFKISTLALFKKYIFNKVNFYQNDTLIKQLISHN